ncbi:hypothetical protein A2276_04585 [candidate division WOR-1 bacterium RIFOXYA12_FULL_43_27]|uniref:Uncharacterized protein n=1 Tax=candidate division WOR-1 bacterium RIFOXYC2_FULL_46_14 TaxID=1802587 RepID=A0A1F4U457_UNCSA|nr:MAG: hypothetical protein A2276_04585 [candidate division WOR-1 bacterium RIFOXYA12_FULL_43_27]OGC18897.1 MAG: hypothetical protein A2292_08250 [candidate division WOR-1 bacterium RIFOXYB2_FULL_46_45]OGC29038.1 MAG: hypothetical protein A2232_03315 [candidate division WOR-1 bacterium RIFOXYA2_FULL_46_56]OGC39659.1 MAG: hypothetical protein A2438_06705 [candidate division WOR-1 bacterium RIFOXYC2_FULL_46_14]
MVEQILSKVKRIEEQAEAIVKQAKNKAALEHIKLRERQEAESSAAEKQLREEGKKLLEEEAERLKKQAREIIALGELETERIREKAAPKISQAKKEILKCL